MDNKRSVEGSYFRNPGTIGWGLERPHLRAKSTIITDDMQIAEYPVPKNVIKGIDRHRTGQFTRMDGDRATEIDKKLGINDYSKYHAMNYQAQRQTLKALDAKRKIDGQPFAKTMESLGAGGSSTLQHKVPLKSNSVMNSPGGATAPGGAASTTQATTVSKLSKNPGQASLSPDRSTATNQFGQSQGNFDLSQFVNSFMENPYSAKSGLNKAAATLKTQ